MSYLGNVLFTYPALDHTYSIYTLSLLEKDCDISTLSSQHMCVFSRVQKRIPGLTHQGYFLQRYHLAR